MKKIIAFRLSAFLRAALKRSLFFAFRLFYCFFEDQREILMTTLETESWGEKEVTLGEFEAVGKKVGKNEGNVWEDGINSQSGKFHDNVH